MNVGNSIDCKTRLFRRRVFLTGGGRAACTGFFLNGAICTGILFDEMYDLSELLDANEIFPSNCCKSLKTIFSWGVTYFSSLKVNRSSWLGQHN